MEWKKLSTLVQTILVPPITVGTALMVAWLNHSVSKVDQELKEQIAAVDIAIKEARDEREKIQAEREFNFRIYELVQQSIEEENERKQEVAKQFVLVMVDGELRKRLLGVLEAGGTPSIRADTRTVIREEEAFETAQTQIFTQQRKATPSFNWEDWDYDIFWCSSSGPEARKQAELIKRQLEHEGAAGRLRVRELPDSVNARSGYKVSGYQVRRSEDEVTQASALIALAEGELRKNGYAATFAQLPTSSVTKWYISAFVCP